MSRKWITISLVIGILIFLASITLFLDKNCIFTHFIMNGGIYVWGLGCR